MSFYTINLFLLGLKLSAIVILPFFLFFLARELFNLVKKRDTNFLQYKINNFAITWSITLLYISFILGLNILRIFAGINLYNSGTVIDIKPLISNISKLIATLHPIVIIYALINIILAALCYLLIWKKIHDVISRHLIALNLYINEIGNTKIFSHQTTPELIEIRKSRRKRFHTMYYENLQKVSYELGNRDLIRWVISKFLWNLELLYCAVKNIKNAYISLESESYLFVKILRHLSKLNNTKGLYALLLSPLLVFFFDCAFNNLVINHTIYWLIFLLPILQFRRFTVYQFNQVYEIQTFLFDLYYSNNLYYFAIPKIIHGNIEYYISQGLTFVDEWGIDHNFDIQACMYAFCFTSYNHEKGLYNNLNGDEFLQVDEKSFLRMDFNDEVSPYVWIYVGGKPLEFFDKNKDLHLNMRIRTNNDDIFVIY